MILWFCELLLWMPFVGANKEGSSTDNLGSCEMSGTLSCELLDGLHSGHATVTPVWSFKLLWDFPTRKQFYPWFVLSKRISAWQLVAVPWDKGRAMQGGQSLAPNRSCPEAPVTITPLSDGWWRCAAHHNPEISLQSNAWLCQKVLMQNRCLNFILIGAVLSALPFVSRCLC